MYPRPIVYHGRVKSAGSIHFNAHYFRAPGSAAPGPRREEIEAWCRETLGSPIRFRFTADEDAKFVEPRGRWFRTGSTWVVYEDDDALAFRMRWC
jgi:hypothetical protein